MTTGSIRRTAVVGLGVTMMTRRFVKSSTALAAEAVQMALDDAGLTKDDLDGLVTHPGMRPDPTWAESPHVALGLRNLRVLNHPPVYSNSPPGHNMFLAIRAIQTRMAETIC